MADSFSYVVHEASSVAYLLTNLLVSVVALMAYFQTRRMSLLILAISSGCAAVTSVGYWITWHFLAKISSYSLIMGSLQLVDIINQLVCVAALVWLIRSVADTLPPPLPKQRP